MLILFAFVTLMLLILLFEKKRFIFYVPLLLQISDISKIMITGGAESRASILLDYSIIITSISVCLFIILGNVSSIKKYSNGVFILLLYLFVMILFSTDIWWSFKRYMNVALAFLMFPAAFILVKNIDDIKQIIKLAIWLILVFLLNTAISTYLNLGIKEAETYGYRKAFVYLGSVNFFSGYGFVYALILIPLAYYLTNKIHYKYFLILLYFAGLFTLILILKRSYVYLTLAGALIFIFFLTKRKSLRFIGPFFIIGFITYILLSDYILASISVRQEVIRRGYSEEGRGIELILYPEVVKYSPDPTNFMLFGEELFNSKGKFRLIEKVLNDKDRLLHSDVATVLYGAGIIGLLLLIRMYYFFLIKYLRLRRRLKKVSEDEILKKLFSTFVSLFICLFINTLSDGMMVATNRVMPYLMMGAILGLMYKKLYSPVNKFSNTFSQNV
jgi:hypothetical protein